MQRISNIFNAVTKRLVIKETKKVYYRGAPLLKVFYLHRWGTGPQKKETAALK